MTGPAPDPVTGDQFAVEFDFRDDGGARLVGPFPTREAAQGYLAVVTCDYSGNVAPLRAPTT